MSTGPNPFLKIINHPLKRGAFLFSKLPAAFFSGLRIVGIDEKQCSVSVPYKWLTQNPFRSTYFASLAMAAEMSTGVLAMMQVYKRKPPISMLLTNIEGSFYRKVTGRATFTCSEGDEVHAIVMEAITKKESTTIRMKSVGENEAGDIIAEFFFTWSFKVK